jgi:hypothetical protein
MAEIVRLNGVEIDHNIISGVSFRAWLAGMAMQGFVSGQDPDRFCTNDSSYGHTAKHARGLTVWASLAIADDLIAELEKET